jgi:hypothetical protein
MRIINRAVVYMWVRAFTEKEGTEREREREKKKIG